MCDPVSMAVAAWNGVTAVAGWVAANPLATAAVVQGVSGALSAGQQAEAARDAGQARMDASQRAIADLSQSYGKSKDALTTGYADASAASKLGYDDAGKALTESYTEAKGYYDPYAQAGNTSLDMYMRGLIGGESTITDSPIYQAKLERLQRDTASALAATGKGRSGVGITGYMQPGMLNLYDQESQNYFNRLTPMINTGYAANTALAGNANQYGVNRSSLATNYADQAARNAINQAQNMSSIESAYGTNQGNLQLGIGATQANTIQQVANANTQMLQAPAAAYNAFQEQEALRLGYKKKADQTPTYQI